MAVRKLEIVVPVTLLERLEKVAAKSGLRKEDLIARALVKVIEEFEKG
jgi:sulfur transfer complex TusBCD TusB component (DsrH family)